MKIAFIINCHANANQVFKLYQTIKHPDCYYLFHISTTYVGNFKNEIKELLKDQKNVFFPKAEDGTHCEFGIVQGPLNALEFLQENNIEYDYASLISGQDYPIKPIHEILNFYKENYGKQYMVSFPILPPEDSEEFKNKVWFPTWSHQQKYRFDKVWIKNKFGRKAYPLSWIEGKTKFQVLKILAYESRNHLKNKTLAETLADIKLSWKHKGKRPLPKTFELYGGLTWWNITKEFAEYLLNTIKSNPEYLNFFKETLIPDEMFMQTLLANSPFKDSLANNDKRYIVWDWEINGTHPLTIKLEDFDKLIESGDHFARKFDLENHPEIFDKIDNELLKNE